MLHNLKLLASCHGIKIPLELCYIIRKYGQKSAQVENSRKKGALGVANISPLIMMASSYFLHTLTKQDD